MAAQKIIEQKQVVVNEITDKAKKSASIVLFEYRGLSVGEMTELRVKLKESGSDIKIYKNTLTELAFEKLNIAIKDELNGPKAMVFGSDAIAPIKVLSDYAKKHPALTMKVGYVDGEVVGVQQLAKLATIPSRDVLLTLLAASLIGPVKNLAIVLDLHAQNLQK